MNLFTREMKEGNQPEVLAAIPKEADYGLADKCLYCCFFKIQEYPKMSSKLGPCIKWKCLVSSDGICKQYGQLED